MTEKLHINSKIKLNDGNSMPTLGLGTGSLRGEQAYLSVKWALEFGYRHIDTAWWYKNEHEVGRAIADSSVPREEIFVTTKVWPSHIFNPSKALDDSLVRLGLEYVDLFLIHRQIGANKRTWQAMENLKKKGLAKSIGVSNFSEKKLKHFLEFSQLPPVVNQVRCSVLYYPAGMHKFCASNKVAMVGYSPLTRGHISDIEGLREAAQAVGKSPAQILLRWAIEKGIPVIPRSEIREYIKENSNIYDFTLNDKTLSFLAKTNKVRPSALERIKLLL